MIAASHVLRMIYTRLAATVPVAARLGHVAHEGGREHVVEPPGSGPRFERGLEPSFAVVSGPS